MVRKKKIEQQQAALPSVSQGSAAYVIEGREPAQSVSRAMPEDPFLGSYGPTGILEPPYNLELLSAMPDQSNILPQCIDAMSCNCDGFGYTLELRDKSQVDPDGDGKYPPEVDAEKRRIEAFFDFCNPVLSYDQIRRQTRKDLEATGNAFWEIIRDGKGEPCWIEHVAAYTMRLTALDAETVEVDVPYYDDQGQLVYEKYNRRFRRYVQIRNGRRVYFKEFGDPRQLNAATGAFAGDEGAITPATEIIHFKLYSASSPYGVPRWIGNLLSVLGSRDAEEVNKGYFDNNTIPPLALLVSGTLSKETAERIADFVQNDMRGKRSFNKILVVQAAPATMPIPGSPPPRAELHFEHLSDAQQKDALFLEYDKNNRDKVRSSFRLPPIYVGQSEDYTKATADESKKVAEEQVFGPERSGHDFVINRLLFPALNVHYWLYKSQAPARDDTETMGGLIKTFSDCGMTVRECRTVMSDMLHRDLALPETLEGDETADTQWLDLPMSVYIEQLRIGAQQAQAEAQMQAFALSREGQSEEDTAKMVEKFTSTLLKVRENIVKTEANID